jgi:hypothetical protein
MTKEEFDKNTHPDTKLQEITSNHLSTLGLCVDFVFGNEECFILHPGRGILCRVPISSKFEILPVVDILAKIELMGIEGIREEGK